MAGNRVKCGLLNTMIAIILKDLRQYYLQAPVIGWGLLFPITLAILLGYYGAGMGAWRTIPGIIAVALLFSSSSMGQVVISFDRMSGGFEIYTHAPIKPVGVVLGKALGGFIFGLIGSSLAILALYIVSGRLPLIHSYYLLYGLIIGSLLFSLLGVAVSLAFTPLRAVTVLNGLRFGMVFLGGLIPSTVIPRILHPIVWSLPMCYIADLIRYGTFNLYEYVTPLTSIIATVIYLVMLFFLSMRLVDKIMYP